VSELKRILLQDSSVQHGFEYMKQVCNCEVVRLGICLWAQGLYGCDLDLLGRERSFGIFGFMAPFSTTGGHTHDGGTFCTHLQG
jgi:hypothetical protein